MISDIIGSREVLFAIRHKLVLPKREGGGGEGERERERGGGGGREGERGEEGEGKRGKKAPLFNVKTGR